MVRVSLPCHGVGDAALTDHRAVRKNPESGKRTERHFAFSPPRRLGEWKASNRIEDDERLFHVENLEETLQQKENRWRTTMCGHEEKETMDNWPNEINH